MSPTLLLYISATPKVTSSERASARDMSEREREREREKGERSGAGERLAQRQE